MSILIKGMEMPMDGNEMIIRILPDGTVLDQYGHHLAITAISVPPHRRLIDADALRTFAYERQKETGIACCVDALDISLAPTVIPASEEVYDKYTDTAGNLHWTGTHSGKQIVKAEEGE